MSQKVVFIAGLHRSGTTVLELILGNYLQTIGLGEIHKIMLEPNRTHIADCGCGIKVSECPFWKTAHYLHDSNDMEPKYRHLLNHFDRDFKNHILIDSSKTIKALNIWQSTPNVDIRVIFLIRDVRAWTTSQIKSNDKTSALRYFLRWHQNNRRIKKHLIQSGVSFLQVGYEELILSRDPFAPLKKIADFIGTEVPTSISLESAASHSISGNRMRHDPEKRKNLFYDYKWFYSSKCLIPMVIFPWILRYNNREVYNHY